MELDLKAPLSDALPVRISRSLFVDDVRTAADLAKTILTRGRHWWLPIPGFTQGRADIVRAWLENQTMTCLTPAIAADPFLDDTADTDVANVVFYQPGKDNLPLAPLSRIRISAELDGSFGENRQHSKSTIRANNDREAIRSFLLKHREEPKTMRSYQKELERFLLWCITERGCALSSAMQEECEAYKDFLATIKKAEATEPKSSLNNRWVGERKQRHSAEWKPFAGELSSSSQAYAFIVLKTFFKWLVDVRYLSANPWHAVSKPRTIKRSESGPRIQVEKAFPADLWLKLTEHEGILDQLCAMTQEEVAHRYKLRGQAARMALPAQFRLAKATILLSGDTGLRREELATSLRSNLKRVAGEVGLWELYLIGKGFKERTVYLNGRVVAALRAHWLDRGVDFDKTVDETPLISPVISIKTKASQKKHCNEDGKMINAGFTPDGIYKMVISVYRRIGNDLGFASLTIEERDFLSTSCVHALRHTFGRRAAAKDMPLDVLQGLMGHASLQTTTLYVQSEKKRSIKEAKRFLSD